MADLAEGLVRASVQRLVVAGGETSGAIVDRLGIPGFLVGAEIAAGVPVRRVARGRRGGATDAAGAEVRQFRWTGFFEDALWPDDLMDVVQSRGGEAARTGGRCLRRRITG